MIEKIENVICDICKRNVKDVPGWFEQYQAPWLQHIIKEDNAVGFTVEDRKEYNDICAECGKKILIFINTLKDDTSK